MLLPKTDRIIDGFLQLASVHSLHGCLPNYPDPNLLTHLGPSFLYLNAFQIGLDFGVGKLLTELFSFVSVV